jgi:hypothetical protein
MTLVPLGRHYLPTEKNTLTKCRSGSVPSKTWLAAYATCGGADDANKRLAAFSPGISARHFVMISWFFSVEQPA